MSDCPYTNKPHTLTRRFLTNLTMLSLVGNVITNLPLVIGNLDPKTGCNKSNVHAGRESRSKLWELEPFMPLQRPKRKQHRRFLTNLTMLSLVGNVITNLPLEIGNLELLRIMSVDDSKLQATLNPQPSTLNPQPSTLNPQPSALNPQPSTTPSNPHHSTLNPQP